MAQLVKSGIGELFPMVRTEGKHVSSAIRRMCIQLGHFDDRPLPADMSLLELGNSFEDALCAALAERFRISAPDRYIRIGEQEFEGIFGTPDLVDLEPWLDYAPGSWRYEFEQATGPAGIEVKLTQMSVKHDPQSPKFWRYWKQMQAYGKMLDMRKWRLHIVHEVDWSFGKMGECPHCGKLVDRSHYHEWEPSSSGPNEPGLFTQREMDSAWAMVKAYV